MLTEKQFSQKMAATGPGATLGVSRVDSHEAKTPSRLLSASRDADPFAIGNILSRMEAVNLLEAAGVGRVTSHGAASGAAAYSQALAADLAPFTAKYGPLLKRLETALAMHDEPRKAEIEHLRPELEAMLADTKTLRAVINGQQSAELLEKMLAQAFFNSLAKAKANQKSAVSGQRSEGGQK